jgi:phosphoserine phosphatase RsbU/P
MEAQEGGRPWTLRGFDEEQIGRDLRFAARVQSSLLTARCTSVPGASAHGCIVPYYAIGGDFLDFLVLPDGTLRVIVADVMGKGLSAALLATMFQGAIRIAGRQAASPGKLLRDLNAAFYPDLQGLKAFVTAVCVDYHPATDEVIIAAAGSPYPLLIHGVECRVEQIKARGVALGVRPDRTYDELAVPCATGDTLMLFSDGVVDVKNRDGKFLGVDGLEQMLASNRLLDAPDFFHSVLVHVAGYADDLGVRDDVTLAAMHIGEHAGWAADRAGPRTDAGGMLVE